MGREGHHAKIFRQTFISHSNFAHLKPLLLYHIPIFFIKNTAENPAFPLGFSAVILFSCLCSDFRPVLEGHPDIVFAVHCDEIHQAAPQPGIELLNEILIPKLLDEAVHLTAPGLAILDGFTGLVVLRLRCFIPTDQFVVVPVIIILVLRDPGVLGYELLYLVGQQVQICAYPVPLLFQVFCVSEPFLQQCDAVKYVRFVFDELIDGPDEGFLDIILCQMWCLAMALELIVASVDGSAVLVGRMPDLGPVPASALAALDFAGEDGYAAVTSPAFTPPLDFFLYPVEDLRADDGFVVIFHIVLRHFPFIRFRFFGQEVDGEPLLQQGIALVFLICQDALYRPRIPAFLSCRSFQPSGSQLPGNGVEGIPVQEQTVNQFHRPGLFPVDGQITIRPFVIAQKMPVGNTHLSISEPLPMAPGDVFRNAPAFFLCQAAHDGDEEFSFSVQRPDVFLLEINLDALIFEFPHCGQTVDGVSGKAADRLRNDEVYFPIHGIPDHPLEAIAVTRVGSRDAFIGVDANEFPVIPLLDVIRIIVHLCGIAGNLVIMIRGNPGISSYSPLLPAVNRGRCITADGGRDDPYCLCHFSLLSFLRALGRRLNGVSV